MINLQKIKENDWANKKVSIIGAGITGLGAARLAQYLKMDVLLSDINLKHIDLQENDTFDYECGHSERILKSDFIIKSPGIPNKSNIIKNCISTGIPIVSEIEFASWFSDSEIIAITGSNGKTTTVNLLFSIFKNAGVDVALGGNVGKAYSENILNELKSKQKVVHILEISSYQAEHLIHFNPIISCILNISEDHMDRYKDIDDYIDAKLNIARNLSKKSKFIYNNDDKYLKKKIENTESIIPYSINENSSNVVKYDNSKILFRDNNSIDISKIKLKGKHNLHNILAASTIADLYGINSSNLISSIKNFDSLPHRIQFINEVKGVTYINDSKSTNIASTIAAIECFRNINLIIGGETKGTVNIEEINSKIIHNKNISNIIIYGAVVDKIKSYLKSKDNIYYFDIFKDAVNASIKMSSVNDHVLLSPAFASFDQFSNYEERGNAFIEIVESHSNDK